MKKETFFHASTPVDVYLHRLETEGLADGLSGRLTQPQWTRRILAVSWTGGVGEERSEGKINNRVTGSDDEPVRSERQ